jgi:hypothetical protein
MPISFGQPLKTQADPEASGTRILVSDAGRIDRVTTPVSTSSGLVPATL